MAAAFLFAKQITLMLQVMTDLVFNGKDGQALTNSLLVAEKFGKEHRSVLSSIRELIKGGAENYADPMFMETTYTHPQNGQEYPMFIMNRDGFTLLAMGFTGERAMEFKLEFLNAFNKMESLLKSDDYILMRSQQILQGRLELAEKNLRKVTAEKEQLRLTAETQEQQLKEQAPKVDYYDKVIDSTGLQTTNMIASCFGISPIKLNKLLCAWGVQYKQSGCYFLYAKYRDKGYAEHKPYAYVDSNGETKTRQHMFWTERGKQFVIDLYTLKAKEERAKRALGKQEAGQVKKEEAAL